MTSQKNYALVIVLILAVVVAVGYIHYYPASKTAKQPAASSQVQTAPAPPAVSQTNVDASKLPAGFPADIPLEAGAQITQNFTAQANTGLSQATRVWVTTKTLDQEFQVYQTFFGAAKNGWTVQNTVNQPGIKAITAGKGKVQVTVNIIQNSVTKQNTVNISATWPG
jgi:hypothetical protein